MTRLAATPGGRSTPRAAARRARRARAVRLDVPAVVQQDDTVVVRRRQGQPPVSRSLNAFQAFSFVEAAVLLVSAGVLAMLFARAEGARLPAARRRRRGRDGRRRLGGAADLLPPVRQARPAGQRSASTATVGVEWGIFFALLLALGLLATPAGACARRDAARTAACAPRRAHALQARPDREQRSAPPRDDERPARRRPRSTRPAGAARPRAGAPRSEPTPEAPRAPAAAASRRAGARAIRRRRRSRCPSRITPTASSDRVEARPQHAQGESRRLSLR